MSLTEAQQKDWNNAIDGAKRGNPYATLCLHCYGRHVPPRDKDCPYESIEELKRRIGK